MYWVTKNDPIFIGPYVRTYIYLINNKRFTVFWYICTYVCTGYQKKILYAQNLIVNKKIICTYENYYVINIQYYWVVNLMIILASVNA